MPSFLDELRAIQDSVRDQAEKTIPVPGTGGRMAIKCRPPQDPDARDRLTGVVASYRVGSALTAAQEKQIIVDCCDEILHRDEHGELVRPEGGDGPLRFDASDSRWDDPAITDAHACVASLFNLDTFPLAAAGVADNLVDWLQALEVRVHQRVEGESLGGADDEPSPAPPA